MLPEEKKLGLLIVCEGKEGSRRDSLRGEEKKGKA